MCRFINGDSKIHDDLLGNNLYSYCGNNPLSRVDEQGKFWNVVAGAIIGAIVSFVGTAVANVSSGKAWHTGWVGAVVGGAAAGALVACGHPLAGAFVGAFLESAVNETISYTKCAAGNGTTQKANTRNNRVNSYIRVGRDTVVNGTVGVISGKLAGKFVKGPKYVQPKKLSECIFTAPSIAENIKTGISEVISILIDEVYIGISSNIQEPVLELYPTEEMDGAAA